MIDKINYKDKARELKKRGLIQIDLRKRINPGKKAAITRIWNKNADSILFEKRIIENSGKNGEFVQRAVNSKTQLNKLISAGYLVQGKTAFINKDGYDTVRLTSNKIFRYKNKKKAIEYLIGQKSIVSELKRFSDLDIDEFETTLSKSELANSFKAVRIGNFAPIGFSTNKGRFSNIPLFERPASAVRFDDFNELLNYVSNWEPKDAAKMTESEARQLKNNLIASFSIITIKR